MGRTTYGPGESAYASLGTSPRGVNVATNGSPQIGEWIPQEHHDDAMLAPSVIGAVDHADILEQRDLADTVMRARMVPVVADQDQGTRRDRGIHARDSPLDVTAATPAATGAATSASEPNSHGAHEPDG